MHQTQRWLLRLFVLAGLTSPFVVPAQIDPVPRQLFQFGYNAPFQGHAPFSAYAFYYRNEPNFLRTNLALRLAIAPTYIDSELGIRHVFTEHTDLGIGVAGGGYADSYDEIVHGTFRPKESFVGHGAETSVSLYHRFNPDSQIPLNSVLRGSVHYSTYGRDEGTDRAFELPEDRGVFAVRAGLRWGGKEPTLFPALAMELSIWYEGQFRTGDGTYGYGDRRVEEHSHLFWEQALLAYTFPECKQSFFLSLTAGTSIQVDRFDAYRLGALLPLISEFPLSLPGYYYQEISASKFVLLGGNYVVPLDSSQRWNVSINATTAGVDYLPGLEQAGHWHSGVGGGVLYQTSSIKVMLGYAYGIDAIRSGGRGAHSLGILMQIDWDTAKQMLFDPQQPNRWRGFQRVFGEFGR